MFAFNRITNIICFLQKHVLFVHKIVLLYINASKQAAANLAMHFSTVESETDINGLDLEIEAAVSAYSKVWFFIRCRFVAFAFWTANISF